MLGGGVEGPYLDSHVGASMPIDWDARQPGFGAIVSNAEVVGELEQALAILAKSVPTRPLVMVRLAEDKQPLRA